MVHYYDPDTYQYKSSGKWINIDLDKIRTIIGKPGLVINNPKIASIVVSRDVRPR